VEKSQFIYLDRGENIHILGNLANLGETLMAIED